MSKELKKIQLLLKVNRRGLFSRNIDTKVLFYHMPKCGGTSVHWAIQTGYGLVENLYGKNLIKLDHYGSEKAAETIGRDMLEFRDEILLYFLTMRHPKFVSGHFAFSPRADKIFGNEWSYVTVLREPVNRWFSHFYFNQTIESGTKSFSEHALNTALERFLNDSGDRAESMGQLFVKNLSYFEGRSDLEIAKANLKKFALVGFLEEIPRFELDFKKKFNSDIKVNRTNKNMEEPKDFKAIISPDLFGYVERVCRPDVELYSYAKSALRV